VGANTCVSIEAKLASSLGQPPRWAIVALARPGRVDIETRNKFLSARLKPYAASHNITVLVFSESVFPEAVLSRWRTTFKDVAAVKYINTARNGFNLPERYGYKYMCKFFALDMYDYLKDFDYYMRCDTDCYLNKLDFDILKWTEDNRVEYGYAMRKLEAHKPTSETLPAWVDNYMRQCSLSPKVAMDHPMSTCFNFYNNWHIGKVSFFMRSDVRHFLGSINASGFIQSHRWGDSTIQAYAVRVFMDPARLRQVPNFLYTHGSHGNKIVSTFNDGSETNVPQRLINWNENEKN
jgi:hypothetical protein